MTDRRLYSGVFSGGKMSDNTAKQHLRVEDMAIAGIRHIFPDCRLTQFKGNDPWDARVIHPVHYAVSVGDRSAELKITADEIRANDADGHRMIVDARCKLVRNKIND